MCQVILVTHVARVSISGVRDAIARVMVLRAFLSRARAALSRSRGPSTSVSSVDASFAAGWEHLQRDEFDAAEQAFRAVLDAEPDQADASLYLGMSLAGQGRHAEAIAPLRDAAVARPLDAEVHLRLGISLREIGETFLAMSSLREALQLRPTLRSAQAALDELVSAAALAARQIAPALARSRSRAARRRSHRYTRRTTPASLRALRVGA
jgi:tetratricopeptide (TPR) repeat protein